MPRVPNVGPTKRPRGQVAIRDFPGLMTNVDPLDIPDGSAREQSNLVSSKPGELRVRPGATLVTFDTFED